MINQSTGQSSINESQV